MHSFPLQSSLLFFCARRRGLYEYKNEVELAPRSTVVYAFPRVRLRTARPRCIRRSSAFWHCSPLLANITPQPFIHILPYASRPFLPAHLPRIATRDEPCSFIVPDPVKVVAFVLSYSSRLLYILPRPRCHPPCISIPLRIVSYRPFSHFLPHNLVNVALNQPQSLSSSEPEGLAALSRATPVVYITKANRASKLYYCASKRRKAAAQDANPDPYTSTPRLGRRPCSYPLLIKAEEAAGLLI
ncbi:hypothetical protein C8Q80DRAFT_76790 [Daedaleopsis nitida]|nr:hypothetical protein C8Q80DRAFT_76790 [Daedaleopsis nitida]